MHLRDMRLWTLFRSPNTKRNSMFLLLLLLLNQITDVYPRWFDSFSLKKARMINAISFFSDPVFDT